MRAIFLLFALTFSLLATSCEEIWKDGDENDDTDIPKNSEGFKGNVGSVTILSYAFSNEAGTDSPVKSLSGKTHRTYNKNGGIVSAVNYDAYDNVTGRQSYEYDSDGNLTEVVVYGGTENQLLSRTAMEYDSKGNKISEKVYQADGSEQTYLFEYDSNGNMTNRTFVPMDGDSYTDLSVTYNSKGEATESRNFAADGSLIAKENRTYVSSGLATITRTQYMAADPSLTYVEYITFKYDNSGNLIEYESTSGTDSKPTIKEVHSYDSHGNQIKSESYSYGELVYSFERKFDSMGNYTEVVAYDDCGVPFLMEEYIFTYRH